MPATPHAANTSAAHTRTNTASRAGQGNGTLTALLTRGMHTLLATLLLMGAAQAWAGATTTAVTGNPASSTAGQSVTLSATVTGASPTGNVTFMDGAVTLGTATLNGSGVATLNATFMTYGSHGITASYAGDAGNSASTSATYWQWVGYGTPTTTLTELPPKIRLPRVT